MAKFKIEKNVEKTGGKNNEVYQAILDTMLLCEKGDSFLVPEKDHEKAKRVVSAVSYLRCKYKEFNKTYFSTMRIYNVADVLQGVRVWRDK